MLPMSKIKEPAILEHLERLLEFVSGCAKEKGFTSKRIKEIELATEEALVNIFNYAYAEGPGDVEIKCGLDGDDRLVIEILDTGTPFNPLSLSEPDLTADVADREIGGLGVFFIREMVDEVQYRRDAGRNILTLRASK
ncbi:MAG: ATP-binding protein [Deltaproteobacteria bacterium]|nr:ATP-binding protein [Deltaproteobacteria bacterium]